MKEKALNIFRQPPETETKRLILRAIRSEDRNDIFDYASDPKTSRYLLWSPHADLTYTEKYLRYIEALYKKGEFYDFAVVYKENGKMIGTGGFTSVDVKNSVGELGYVLHPDYWGKGIATELVEELLSFGFNVLDLNRIHARYMVGNEKSRHVMEKCGMTFEGILRNLLYVKDSYRDIGYCSILKEEYYENHEPKTYCFKTGAHWYDRFR